MPCEQNKKDVLREWRESAPYWAKHADIVRSMFAPITQALIEAGGISEGKAVLDVAGGTGEPSITISSVVGLSGSVISTDAVAEMIAAARAEARQRERTNILFNQVDDRAPSRGVRSRKCSRDTDGNEPQLRASDDQRFDF